MEQRPFVGACVPLGCRASMKSDHAGDQGVLKPIGTGQGRRARPEVLPLVLRCPTT